MCRTINSITQNPVAGAYAHIIRGAHQYERWRVTYVATDRRSCIIQRGDETLHPEKVEIHKGLWGWRVRELKAVINFTNVPQVGYISESHRPEGGIVRSTVTAVSEDGTEVTLDNGVTLVLAEYGGYPYTRFKAPR